VYGVPAVGIYMQAFRRLVDSATRVRGVRRLRRAFIPGSPTGKSLAELRAYIDGEDPVAGRSFIEVLVSELTRTPDGQEPIAVDRSTPRLLEPDTEDNLQRLFMENRWTDFLPIVLPTEERVEKMLRGTSHGPDEIVGRLAPTFYGREAWEFTVEKVAVNAVMAGARPEYLPVILALAASGVTARQSSVSSIGTGVIVNGPIRRQIGMNAGIGALGPYNHANATIGRAYGLLSQNLQGGSVPGETYVGSLGNNFSYNNMTFAENEEASPWQPLHVRRGHDPDESTATPFLHLRNYLVTFGVRRSWREKLREMLQAQNPTSGALLIVDPSASRILAEREGFATAEALLDWMHRSATMPAGRWWDHWGTEQFLKPLAEQGIEPWATCLRAEPDKELTIFPREQIELVVVGGETNPAYAVASGRCEQTVSVDAWR
jgi:hypothetical protein